MGNIGKLEFGIILNTCIYKSLAIYNSKTKFGKFTVTGLIEFEISYDKIVFLTLKLAWFDMHSSLKCLVFELLGVETLIRTCI